MGLPCRLTQLLRQKGNDPLSAAIQPWRDGFVQRGNLGDAQVLAPEEGRTGTEWNDLLHLRAGQGRRGEGAADLPDPHRGADQGDKATLPGLQELQVVGAAERVSLLVLGDVPSGLAVVLAAAHSRLSTRIATGPTQTRSYNLRYRTRRRTGGVGKYS